MPVFTNSQQVTLVLQSLLLGVGIGAVYDMLRALRLHFRCGWAGYRCDFSYKSITLVV